MNKIVCHGHFYQPPREDPWSGTVPPDPSAVPDHDWNTRITRECYAALAAVPVRDHGNDAGETTRTINTYGWLSFDVGPTLARWLERERPAVYKAMQEGDRLSIERSGYGTAIAAPYHHIILPLASRKEKVTEVRWGIKEFERTFGRTPFGFWLPETAVDSETLEVLATAGIRYTILSPDQVAVPDPSGKPLRWSCGSAELLVFCYDGALSHNIAFGDALRDGGQLASQLHDQAVKRTVTSFATDGETFGHHHKWGDLAIGKAISLLRDSDSVGLTNFDEIAALVDPVETAMLNEPTSWSCSHGVGRWERDCGCRMSAGTSQRWRSPLRTGLNNLRSGIDAVLDDHWQPGWGDRIAVRDDFGPGFVDVELPAMARCLLKADRHSMAMFTSCAWFFDDISRIEPWLVLRQAVRALELLPVHEAGKLRLQLQADLADAVSNLPNGYNAAELLDLNEPPDVVA